VAAAVAAHEAAADPHPVYLTGAEGTATFAPISHAHTIGDLPATVATDAEVATAVANHEAAADPHTGYQKESEKGAANGYAPLGADSKVPAANLPAAGGGIPPSLIDAKGDLIVGSAADTAARLAVGATAGHVLTVDSDAATGVKWAAGGASRLQTHPLGSGTTVRRFLSFVPTTFTANTVGMQTNSIIGDMFDVTSPLTITGLGAYCNGTATGPTVTIALVEGKPTGGLGTVLAQGTINVTTTGRKELIFGSPVTVVPGVTYWLVVCTANPAPTFYGFGGSYYSSGGVLGDGNQAIDRAWYQNGSYPSGNLPNDVGALGSPANGFVGVVWVLQS